MCPAAGVRWCIRLPKLFPWTDGHFPEDLGPHSTLCLFSVLFNVYFNSSPGVTAALAFRLDQRVEFSYSC